MHIPRKRFGKFSLGLRWQLTRSYILVTVGASLIAILTLAVLLFYAALEPASLLTPANLVEILSTDFAPQTAIPLAKTPPDMTAIAETLAALDDSTISQIDIFQVDEARIALLTNARFDIVLVGKDGNLWGITPGKLADELTIGEPFDPLVLPESAAPLKAALDGEHAPEQLWSRRQSDNALIVVVPVFAPEDASDNRTDSVVGALVLVLESLPTRQDIPAYILQVFGTSLIWLTLIAGGLGALFGSLVARRLLVRFQRLSAAGDAWSRGDFSQLINDSADDELGKLSRQMDHMAQQLAQLLDQSRALAASQERDRLARDLHDSAKQLAFAASARMGAAQALFESDPFKAQEHLEGAAKLIDRVRQELNDLIQQLRPIETTDFEIALKANALDWSKQSDIQISVNIVGSGKLPPESQAESLRILQEALSNIARHSGASKAEIRLDYQGENIILQITDNGQGFDTSKPSNGLGLHSMAERARALGGSFQIESMPGEGTRVLITCPHPPEVL